MNEKEYDQLLNITTTGKQKVYSVTSHYHRYEPTPYEALEGLFREYHLKQGDRVVDFGCGKGRISFYINHFYQNAVTGVEVNEDFYKDALNNLDLYLKKHQKSRDRIHFHCALAQEYPIHPVDNRFYFFNPFTMPIFMSVINNILLSVEHFPREVELILYYATEEYTYFLDDQTAFELMEEVRLPGLYDNNPYEKFLIYSLK
ncbi:class I SAM-dependent methyltransferase [Fictibacillus enclensis]|uniref:class I SAM-dependent methyltransferase n=1 Tax=Fictibacillus enclensis TaxID=1017270 RepID=UPI0024BF6C5C|nr:class I SAM-dependent methyltransferase [Fictibacillus enclensis]WHY72957.1 class I SAM-dependent methyltransferase [Fictibacillus enclensis]